MDSCGTHNLHVIESEKVVRAKRTDDAHCQSGNEGRKRW
jgi:hypothetical protein